MPELAAGVRLGRLVSGCGPGGLVARFVPAGDGVVLTLTGDGMAPLRRGVPWLRQAAEPLTQTALADRMGALGVLIDGLLLEHQLAAADPAPPAAPPSAAPPSEVAPAPEVAPPSAAPPSVPAARPAPPVRRRPPPPTPTAAPATAPEAPPPGPAAVISEAAPAAPPFDPGPAPPPEPPPFVDPAPPEIPTPPPSSTPLPAPAPVWGGFHLGGRWRTPDLLVPQAWARAGYGPAGLGLGWQPRIRWASGGRRFTSQTSSLALSGVVPIRLGPVARLTAPIGLVGERTAIEREDVGGPAHTLYQVGFEAGLAASLQLSDWLWLTADGVGRWLPWGDLRIEAGPAVPFNRAGAEVGLGLLVAPGW